jgi:hypothetical protein
MSGVEWEAVIKGKWVARLSLTLSGHSHSVLISFLSNRHTPGQSLSGDADTARDLAVAFPISVLFGDQGIVHSRLNLPCSIDRAGGDSVLSG